MFFLPEIVYLQFSRITHCTPEKMEKFSVIGVCISILTLKIFLMLMLFESFMLLLIFGLLDLDNGLLKSSIIGFYLFCLQLQHRKLANKYSLSIGH